MPSLKSKKITRRERIEQQHYIMTKEQLPKNIALQIEDIQHKLAWKSKPIFSNSNIEDNFIKKNQTWDKLLISFLIASDWYKYANIENWSNDITNQLKISSNSLENSSSNIDPKFVVKTDSNLVLIRKKRGLFSKDNKMKDIETNLNKKVDELEERWKKYQDVRTKTNNYQEELNKLDKIPNDQYKKWTNYAEKEEKYFRKYKSTSEDLKKYIEEIESELQESARQKQIAENVVRTQKTELEYKLQVRANELEEEHFLKVKEYNDRKEARKTYQEKLRKKGELAEKEEAERLTDERNQKTIDELSEWSKKQGEKNNQVSNNSQNKQSETSIPTEEENTEIEIPKINEKPFPVNTINNHPENAGSRAANSIIENEEVVESTSSVVTTIMSTITSIFGL